MRKVLFVFAGFSLLLVSCGRVLLPYNEEPLCRKGPSAGFCGSLSEIYEDMEKNPEKYGIGGRAR